MVFNLRRFFLCVKFIFNDDGSKRLHLYQQYLAGDKVKICTKKFIKR